MTSHNPSPIVRRNWIILPALIVLTLASGCATQAPKVEAKPASFWPPAPDEPRIQFLAAFEKSSDVEPPKTGLDKIIMGNEPQQVLPISKPYGLRMWDGKIYVCDLKQHGVIVLDLRNRLTRIIGTTGGVTLETPTDLAIAPDGMKYVTDMSRGAVVVYDSADKQVNLFSHANFKPVAAAVYGDELAVADFQLQHIEIMDRATGQVRRTIGGPGMPDGKFIRPIGLSYDGEGNLYTVDFMKCRIQKFSREGKLLGAFGESSPTVGSFVRPKHMVVDKDSIIYVVDAAFQNVQMFNSKGKTLTFFGSAGRHQGSMQLPVGVCVTDDAKDIELFRTYIHPAFDVKRLVLVTNQFGPFKVAVYGYGQLKTGLTVKDIASQRNIVPVDLNTGPPTTLPTTLPEEGGTISPPPGHPALPKNP